MSVSLLNNIEQRVSDLQFQLQYRLQPIEDLRLEYKKQLKTFWLIVVASLAIFISIVLFLYLPLAPLFIILIIGYILTYIYWIKPLKKNLCEQFHNGIVPHIVSEFLSETYFNANSYISEKDYFLSNLFRRSTDKYDGSNLTQGNLGQTSVLFSNLHTQYKTQSTDSKGRTRTQWHTIFRGVFLIADSNKNFNGEIYIFPDTAERIFGGIGRWMQEKFGATGRGEMIYLEDPDFEKRYVVYATDPVEARYILTPSMQQYFMNLSDTFGKGSLHASFINGKLYLALSGDFELFTLNTNKPLNDEQTIKYYVGNLIHILSAVEILDLNTRIWNK